MWIRSQDKMKLYNLDKAGFIRISKSYGSKDKNGNKLTAAIVLENSTSLGLYNTETDALNVINSIERFISEGVNNVFQMP